MSGRLGRVRAAAVGAALRVGLAVLPRTPERVKRLLLAGRPVTVDGNTLDTTLRLVFAADNALGIGRLVSSRHIPTARADLRRQARALRREYAVDVSELTLPGPATPIGARLYRPREATTASPLLVYFHGGGMVLGDLDTHDHLCRLICHRGGIRVLSIDYRRAPEHKAPAAADDAYAAYRWALDNAAGLGAEPGSIAVGGDSSGGNLAAVVAQRARDDSIQLPALQLLLYPAVDQSRDTPSGALFADGYYLSKENIDWFTDLYLTGSGIDVTDPRVSPLLAEDLSGLPPALVVTAGFDPLRDEGNAYAEAMRAAGVAVDLREERTLGHSFATNYQVGGRSVPATAEVISALRAHLSRTEGR